MKTHVLFSLALCCAFAPVVAQAETIAKYLENLPLGTPLHGLPSTNSVVKYERFNQYMNEWKWLAVSKTDGDTVLACLYENHKFGYYTEKSSARALHFRYILENGSTNVLQLSSDGAKYDRHVPGFCLLFGLAIPDAEREILSQLFTTWHEADIRQITSQPLPCQYHVCSNKCGDTLSDIARLFYGDATKWPLIWESNKTAIPNPDIIRHGQIITIPKLETTPP